MENEDATHQSPHPDLSLLRAGLFCDTDIKKIDWIAQRRAVIERILERGNDQEHSEIKRFYGELLVAKVADDLKRYQVSSKHNTI